MPELPRGITQVNIGVPNISSGSAYHPGVAEDFRQSTHALKELDQQISQAEWRRQASDMYAQQALAYSTELQELKTTVTDPVMFQESNKRLAEKYLLHQDNELMQSMHPRALAMYKESLQPFVMQNFQTNQNEAFKARAQAAVSGLLNAIDVNIADAAAQGLNGLNLADHVARMEENVGSLPGMFVDKDKVLADSRNKLFRALGESHAREHPEETLSMLSPSANGEAKFVIKIPSQLSDRAWLEEDVLKMDPLMNQHLYTMAMQSLEHRNTLAQRDKVTSDYHYKLTSERAFTDAVVRILKGETGVVDKQSTIAQAYIDGGKRSPLDGTQLNQLREMSASIAEKRAKGEPTTAKGYAKGIDLIYRGNPSFDSLAGLEGVSTDDSINLMGKLFTEKEKLKTESYGHYKTMRNEAEDTIRAMVLAKNPMAAFGEINPVAEMLVSKFRNAMDEKENKLMQEKAGPDAWRHPGMNPKTIAAQMLIDQEPMLKQSFEHDAEKLVSSLVQYMPSGQTMSYKGISEMIQKGKEPEATKKMMLALLYQARAQKISESQFDLAMRGGVVPGNDKSGVRKQTWLEWFRSLMGPSGTKK